ncbi:hypothetical protein QEM13_003751 [Pseudomonas putida]|nr:hypothetical protein [Pseudomonas putida]
MSTETLQIEISWPESMHVPAGATANVQLWVGNEISFYRMLSDGDVSVPASSSPAVLEIAYDPQALVPDDSTATWGHFHTAPYLMHDGKRLNIARTVKVSIDEAKRDGWKIALS